MQNIPSSTAGTDLLSLGRERLNWLQERQQILAGNVANADTPNFKPKDISPFENTLNQFNITPITTHTNDITVAPDFDNRDLGEERSLNGNQVSLEQQMEQISHINDQQHFAVNIYSKYLNMFQTVLGR
ncbi:flagellar basal body rod protein FlgB [Swingsia samuiensis]|uniref:Flagellar biosynthesis protein FlgB n=1 Tax=Swingsia samuiensis TaxID=1293412 RepID=A0A4Y6UID3_9PROT|nr:flagellar basal body protein [Swingsia samuiensis]QDH16570.1 flagellar biosynthesis protein FlgB [Swingsia samuiensis]